MRTSFIKAVQVSCCLLLLLIFLRDFWKAPQVCYEPAAKVVEKGERIHGAKLVDEFVNPIPDHNALRQMSLEEIQELYYNVILSPQFLCTKIERMGDPQDGGWNVCFTPPFKPDPNNCFVYSFGINRDFTFDDAMGDYGCEVHSFDPSMKTGDHQRSKKVAFHNLGIASVDTKYKGWQLLTLNSTRSKLGHQPSKRKLDMVKMDVEGSESPSLIKALADGSLDDVRQLAFETHLTLKITTWAYVKNLDLFRHLFEKSFRMYTTTRNINRSTYYNTTVREKTIVRTKCHETYWVNTKFVV